MPWIGAGERRPACVKCPGCLAGRLSVRDEITRHEVDRADQRALRVGYERHRPAARQRWMGSPGDAAAGELDADDHPRPAAEQLPPRVHPEQRVAERIVPADFRSPAPQ